MISVPRFSSDGSSVTLRRSMARSRNEAPAGGPIFAERRNCNKFNEGLVGEVGLEPTKA